ncbi:MAG TPA: phosphotransferase family protein [Ilumatobacteraceae bacterium]
MSTDDLRRALAEVLSATDITGLRHLSGGASRETWSFDADGRPLILQRQRRGDTRNMATEASILRAARAAGVPVAALIADSVEAPGESNPLGAGFIVLERVSGETIARKILRDEAFAHARERLTRDCAVALARLHAIPVADVPTLQSSDQLQQYREIFDSIGRPHPSFELVFHWLDAHRPQTARRGVVHGDFRLGNLMVDEDGLAAVLDWELAHIGDPMEDLGWLCSKAWRFGQPQPVAGVGSYDELFVAYAAESGVAVDPDTVHWWEVLGTLKWGIICIMQAEAHLSGASRSHELAAIGRRTCETEHDLFLALDGRW